MPAGNVSALEPLLAKLGRRGSFTTQEADALLALPVRITGVDQGAYLVREGDPSDTCCVLLSGWAYRHKMTGGGSRQILSIHMKGDVVGLDSGVVDLVDHNVQILSRAEAAFVPRQALLDLAGEMPNIGRALWRETLVDASIAREWILNVGQRDARQRVSHLLCEVSVRQHSWSMKDGCAIEWPLTQEQLGDATGLTSVHVNRTIQALRAAGLIQMSGRSATILDWTALQNAGDFSRAYLYLPPDTPSLQR